MSEHPDFPVSGISPLGGNAVEGTSSGFAPVRDTAVFAVPLEYSPNVGVYVSEQAQEELDDKEHARKLSEEFNEEEAFRQKAGYT